MNIENIEAFVYVVHYGSFNKAAEALYLTQPSVSARIQTLERELDSRLFHRNGKTIQLTEEGERFYPYAQQMMLIYQKGKNSLQGKKNLPNELRIGCTVAAANYLLPLILPTLKLKHPEVRYKLVTGSTDEVMQRLLAKEIDLGFVRKTSHPDVQSIPYYEDPIMLFVYQDHRFAEQVGFSIDNIAEEPLIFFECGSFDWHRIHRLFDHLDRPPHIHIQTDNSETAKKLIVEKAGIGFLPSLSARNEVLAGSLRAVPVIQTEGIVLHTNLVSRSGEQPALVKELVAIGKKLLR